MVKLKTPERPRYSLGPEPRTARGKRRHEARGKQEKRHAEACWQKREDFIHALGSRTALQGVVG